MKSSPPLLALLRRANAIPKPLNIPPNTAINKVSEVRGNTGRIVVKILVEVYQSTEYAINIFPTYLKTKIVTKIFNEKYGMENGIFKLKYIFAPRDINNEIPENPPGNKLPASTNAFIDNEYKNDENTTIVVIVSICLIFFESIFLIPYSLMALSRFI